MPETPFERELKSLRIVEFDYIFALRRKDEKAFTENDKDFVRENSHYATNRFSFVDDNKVLFIGTNYEFSEEKVKALKERFDFEDYSKPAEQIQREREKREAERKRANEALKENSKADRQQSLDKANTNQQ